MDRRLRGPESRSGRGGKEKFAALTGSQTPVVQPVAVAILSYPGSFQQSIHTHTQQECSVKKNILEFVALNIHFLHETFCF